MDIFLNILQTISMPLSIGIAVIGFMRTTKKDAKDDGAQVATMMSDIGYIKSGVDDVKAEQRTQRVWNEDMVARMAKVEASAAQAHKRLDELHGTVLER